MANVNIRPLRDYGEHDVLPTFYSFSGTIPANKGTFVSIVSGATADQTLAQLGDVGKHYQNVVSQRYGWPAQVAAAASSGSTVVGMLLYDVKEVDENGEKLILHPDKMQRMQVVPSGWPVPILRRGFVQYSGITVVTGQGENLYLAAAGDGSISTSGSAVATKVGRAYGPTDSQGYTYIFVDVY